MINSESLSAFRPGEEWVKFLKVEFIYWGEIEKDPIQISSLWDTT